MIEGAIPKDPHPDYPADARTDAVADQLFFQNGKADLLLGTK
jgi:hypothetical protein